MAMMQMVMRLASYLCTLCRFHTQIESGSIQHRAEATETHRRRLLGILSRWRGASCDILKRVELEVPVVAENLSKFDSLGKDFRGLFFMFVLGIRSVNSV